MSDSPERRSWRDDSLSLFLALSALLLALMYYLEREQADELDEAAAAAQRLATERLDFDGCLTSSVGPGGATLHLRCATLQAGEAATRAAAAGGLSPPFDSLVVTGTDARMRCRGDAARWPDSCSVLTPP